MKAETTENRLVWNTHRTLDPTGLLRVRVVIKRDNAGRGQGQEQPEPPNPDPANEEEDRNGERELGDLNDHREGTVSKEIQWQDKLFSPLEVQKCRNGVPLSDNQSLSHKYEEQIRQIIQSDPNYSGSEIFTKVAEDRYVDQSELDTPFFGDIGSRKPTELADAVLKGIGHEEMIEMVRNTAQTMHIFASIRLNNGMIHEELLAIIRVFPGGRIDVRPPFSNKKKPRIHYKFFTSTKELITYSLEVLEDSVEDESPFERTLLCDIKRRRAIFEAAQNDCSLAQPPDPPGTIRMFYRGEVCKAIMEDSVGVAVEYQIKLPSDWANEESGFPVEGCSQFSICNDDGVAHVNLPFDMVARCQSQIAPTLFLTLHSYSDDGARIVEGYGTCSLPMTRGSHTIEVPVWRVRGKISEELRLLFLNAGLEQQAIFEANDSIAPDGIFGSENADIVFNKFGLRTRGTGKVIVKINLAMQSSLFGKRNVLTGPGQISSLGAYSSRMSLGAGR